MSQAAVIEFTTSTIGPSVTGGDSSHKGGPLEACVMTDWSLGILLTLFLTQSSATP